MNVSFCRSPSRTLSHDRLDSPQSTVLIYFHTQCRLICHEAILITINKLLGEQYDIYHCIIVCLRADWGVACELFGNLPIFLYAPAIEINFFFTHTHIVTETMTPYVTISYSILNERQLTHHNNLNLNIFPPSLSLSPVRSLYIIPLSRKLYMHNNNNSVDLYVTHISTSSHVQFII